jgi:glycosyltransferase involved in cell wall biosynthesis
MERAAIYVAPSLYEPFGLAPLEAALRGCPLVLSDIGSFRELWDGCAEFATPGDAESLAAGISRLLTEEDRRFRLAEAAASRARGRYTSEVMTRRYLAVYRALSGGDPTSLPISAPARTVPAAAPPLALSS